MNTFPGSPKLLKAGLVLIDPVSGSVRRVISLQYNPETLSRGLTAQGTAGEGGDRLEALRLKGPPVETIKLEAELDATDDLEFPRDHRDTVENGIQAPLAALEVLLYPDSADLQSAHQMAASGSLEILPAEKPLCLFVWGNKRVLPVRITEFSVTEEAFDASLNPTRARLSLGMRVLNVNDLGFETKGGSIFMVHHQQKERLSRKVHGVSIDALGNVEIP